MEGRVRYVVEGPLYTLQSLPKAGDVLWTNAINSNRGTRFASKLSTIRKHRIWGELLTELSRINGGGRVEYWRARSRVRLAPGGARPGNSPLTSEIGYQRLDGQSGTSYFIKFLDSDARRRSCLWVFQNTKFYTRRPPRTSPS